MSFKSKSHICDVLSMGIMIEFIILLFVFGGSASTSSLPSCDSSKDDFTKQLQDVKSNLEKFNAHYLMNLEQRMLNILTTMTSLDSNVKALQDKSQVWDIFQHHIGAWSDHMKSVDHKMDLLKRTHENTPIALETRLSNLDFKVQHIFEKVDTMNEKLHDITKTVYMLSTSNRARRNDRESIDQSAVMTKISHLQKQLNRLESNTNNCQKKNGNNKAKKEVQEFDDELDDFLDKLATKKLKDLAANRKQSRSLDNVMTTLRSVDERTTRIYDLEANQFEQILSCCSRTDREITTFTNSADILLKRIERLVINVDRKIEERNHECDMHNGNSKTEDDLIDITLELGSGKDIIPTTTEIENDVTGTSFNEIEPLIIFHQPTKQGCHQLSNRKNGIYTFASNVSNKTVNDFNRRYCKFATDGPAWTVFQRRELNDLQENFNRSWDEYKNGFGDLNHEFWFGNDFIHMLTYDDNMELRIELEDFDDGSAYAEYKTFRVETEKFNYNLMISDYQGNASDAMKYHNDQDFSTYDRHHDKSNGQFPCALSYGSGWWFNNCAESNLNGIYYTVEPTAHKSTGVLWETWMGDYSLKSSTMMVRPRDVWVIDNEEGMPQDP